ncbi:MAG TPA: TerB family tellurite resistance protein [Thermoanaerobaculia bacterium]|nr:TerB family tellurite resistance protein [Thermoanaerobaculia bacterium]
MSWLTRLFGQGGSEAQDSTAAETDTVRRIVARLDELPPERARWVAAFAYVLGRVANADLEITVDETAEMEGIVRERGGLPEEQAVLVVEIAKSQNRLFGGTENFLVTREFARMASDEERRDLLDALFAVAAADGGISNAEEAQIRQIASELGFDLSDFADVRSGWNEYRDVLKGL